MLDYLNYLVHRTLILITLPVMTMFGPLIGNVLFIVIYCLVLIGLVIKFKSPAVRGSAAIAFIALLVILIQHYLDITNNSIRIGETVYIPALEIYYGIISYIISWLVITYIHLIREQRANPLQHRGQVILVVSLAIFILVIYIIYSLIIDYVIEYHAYPTRKISRPV